MMSPRTVTTDTAHRLMSRPRWFRCSRAAKPGLAVDLLNCLNALDHVGVLGTVLVPYRLDRVLERLLVGDLGDRDAGRLGLVHRFLLILRPQYAFFGLCLFAELDQERLVFLRQRVPGLLGKDEHLGNDQVLIEGVELGHLIVVVEYEARRIVLRAVDDAR